MQKSQQLPRDDLEIIKDDPEAEDDQKIIKAGKPNKRQRLN